MSGNTFDYKDFSSDFSVTNLADGFAKFLVIRAKEELSAAFFEKFRDAISKSDTDIKILFPQTIATMTAIGDQIYNYQTYINALRESFEKDLMMLLNNLPVLINNPRYSRLTPSQKAIGLTSCYFGNALLIKTHPGNIISDYDADSFLKDTSLLKIKGIIKTIQLISSSLQSSNTNRYWVSKNEVEELIKNPDALKIYIGLLYKQGEGIRFSSTDSLQGILSTLSQIGNSGQLAELRNYIKGFVTKSELVESNLRDISGRRLDSILFNEFYSLYSATIDLIEFAPKLNEITAFSGLRAGPGFEKNILNLRTIAGLALDIRYRHYSSAIINTLQIYTNLIDSSISSKQADNKKFFLKYGNLMASIVEAKSSEDVENIIEASALPAGSFRIKRQSKFNVALNAYLGLFGGQEKINGLDNSKSFVSGIAAPIGVAFSSGKSNFFIGHEDGKFKREKKAWSTSIFLSVVDLGALAAFRFENDSIAQVPTILLKNIISPGAFISFGWPNSPISLNFGCQIGPNLREVGISNNEFSNHYYWRFSSTICVDIPVFNFYTRTDD